jgi:hypothetical protein
MPYFYPWTYIEESGNETAANETSSKNDTANSDEKNSTLRYLGNHKSIEKKVEQEASANQKDEVDKDDEIIGIENSGYDNSNMIDNLGFLFIIILMSFVNVALLPFFWIIKTRFKCFEKVYIYFKSMIFWNGFIRFTMEGYLELLINSLINLEIITNRYN